MNQDEWDSFELFLGKLLHNFLELELTIRLLLYADSQKRAGKQYESMNHFILKQGDSVAINAVTNDDEFSNLVEKYNKAVARLNKDLQIDKDLIGIRNAIVHGRLLSKNTLPPPRLVNFGRPKDGKISVTYVADISIDWLKKYLGVTDDSFQKVKKAHSLVGQLDIDPL